MELFVICKYGAKNENENKSKYERNHNIKKRVDEARVNATARKNALCTMSDEEIMVGDVLGMNPEEFVGNLYTQSIEECDILPKTDSVNKRMKQMVHASKQ